MPEKNERYEYYKEDVLFLLLELADYPTNKKTIFNFAQLKSQRYKMINHLGLIEIIMHFKEKLGDLKIYKPTFNFFSLNRNIGRSKKLFRAGLETIRKFPDLPETECLKKILHNEDFGIYDLKTLSQPAVFDFGEFVSGIDFKIKTGKSFSEKATKHIEKNINCFIEDNLYHNFKNYSTFENHKVQYFKKIVKLINESSKDISISENDFDDKCRFLEFIVALHTLKYLELKNILSDPKGIYIANVRVKQKLLDEEKHQKTNNGIKILKPIKLPAKTIWDDLTLKFTSKVELEIFVKGVYQGKRGYDEMGFYKQNSKDKLENAQWILLRKLSLESGVLDYNACVSITARNAMKKKKSALSDNLIAFFGINSDPFRQMPDTGKLQSILKLEPEPLLRGDGELFGIIDDIFNSEA